jgi:hypothetical protein
VKQKGKRSVQGRMGILMTSYPQFIELAQSKLKQCQVVGLMVNSELESVWNETVDAYLK